MGLIKQYARLLAALLLLLLSTLPSSAVDHLVNAAFKQTHIDLLPNLQIVESVSPKIPIELPGNGNGQKIRLTLEAGGSGPVYRWVVFTLGNPAPVPRELVLVVPHQGFTGSHVFWPAQTGSSIQGQQASSGLPPSRLLVRSSDAIAITVAPATTVSYALELKAPTIGKATLWQRAAFDAQNRQYSFFHGVVIGIAMFLAIGFLCLFIVRMSAVFPSAGLFAIAAIGFIAFEAGYMSNATRFLPDLWQPSHSRALVEVLMLLGVIACTTTFLELRSRSALWRTVFIVLAFATMALLGYGWLEPDRASGLARVAFAGVVLLGFVLTVHYWQHGFMRAQATLLPYTVLLIWTLLAGLACIGVFTNEFLDPTLAAGLILVLVTIGFCLAQFAFDHGSGSHLFMRDSGRRALALAGSEQAVWDWHVGDGSLYVGSELERSLGLTPGTVGGADIGRWLELIHPADRAVYVSAVETAERRGRGSFAQEFRLRRADGSYRWYLLRARSMMGDNGIAVRLIGTLADVTTDKRAEERLLSDAVRDRVTGLPNKALLLDRLQRAVVRARKTGDDSLFVLVVDLDRFKSINEGLGHEIGDSILSITARRLNELAGPDDSVGRLPGDRFGLVFSGASPQRDIMAYTDALRALLAQPVRLRDREVLLTGSIGVAHFKGDRARPEDLLKDAEIALFEAKRRGNDVVEFFRSDMRDEQGELIALEQDLRRAVERNEIEVVYQPLMRLNDGQLAGFEALARWRHPKEGLLEPASFMGLAEETGIIRDIGRYVLSESAMQLGIWQRAFRPHDPLFVSVNVSSAQLIDFELVTDVKNLLNREDIQPGTLKLELTETLVMQNPELATNVLDRVRQLGIGLSCDDFGTGYSALANLARLPFDTLKIDRMFLEADAEDERAAVILDTIILLAHDLQLTVVVEGVENGEQIERLKELECDYAQGFYIGQPVTASQVLNALGGMPYGVDTKRGGRSAFWELLRGLGQAVPAAPETRAAPPGPPVQPAAPSHQPVPANHMPRAAAATTPAPSQQTPPSAAQSPLPQISDAPPPAPSPETEALTWPPAVSSAEVEEVVEIWPTDSDTPARAKSAVLEPASEPEPTATDSEPCKPAAEPAKEPRADADLVEENAEPAPDAAPEAPQAVAAEKAGSVDKQPAQKAPAAKKPAKKRAPATKKRSGQLKKKLRKAAKSRKARSGKS
ncbi:MAG: EAL domain-containing protein [Rhizobiales bacterium]|nr:EAL domain-containing protein [Hyphomicrobiales bacterium]